jgi:L-rhamnose mutarotase
MTGTKMCGGLLLLSLMIMAGLCYSQPKPGVRRIGMVIRIKPERIAEYKKLHADSNRGVRDLLGKANIRNFSIFLRQLDDGQYYLFGYYEYTGNNYEAAMAKLAAEPRNKEWLLVTDPMQIPLKGENSWALMEEVYHNK